MNDRTAARAALHAFVARHPSFLLTTHVNPDGDAIGSEVATARWLRSKGKRARILNDSPTPAAFTWLTAEDPIEVYDEALAETRFSEAAALLVLDTGNKQRIGRLARHLDLHPIAIAIVDHHVTHDGFGQVNVIEPGLASAASLAFELMSEDGWVPDRIAAEALYVGLSTDTGNFRYSNTDARAHRMAASLIEAGVDPHDLSMRVSATLAPGRLRFFGEVLAALQMLEEGRLAVIEATPEQFAKHGLSGPDTEGLVDMPRTIAGVEVVALFSEVVPGHIKVSLRSTGRVSIDQVCARLGGGGHPHAAGVQLKGSREQVRERILPELAKLLAALDAAPAPRGGA
jgi:phosphoesterase RecJ-like protein